MIHTHALVTMPWCWSAESTTRVLNKDYHSKVVILSGIHCRAYFGIQIFYNKFAQTNLGRGPRRGAVAHIRRKVPIGYNGAPQIRPQKYPYPWTDPKTPLPASYLDQSDLWCQTASVSDPPFCHKALDRPTDRRTYGRTDRPTDRPRESLTTIGRCAIREQRGLII